MRSRLPAVIALIAVLLELGGCMQVHAYAAVMVYDHGFARQISYTKRGTAFPVNKTQAFTQDDPFAYAYTTASFYSANFTWDWYDPEGQLYTNRTVQEKCIASPCTVVSSISLAGTAADRMLGLWRMDLLAGGFQLYSDHFWLNPIITQDDYWNFTVLQSAPARVHVDLTVTIHPNNLTWSFYRLYMPYATNVTAHEQVSNRPLIVMTFNDTRGHLIDLVDLGGARSDGYRLVLSFDLRSGLYSLGGWTTGIFALTWQQLDAWAWENSNDVHPVPEKFSITLPEGATFVDAVGMNVIALKHNTSEGVRPTVSLATTLGPGPTRYGWTIIYRDLTWADAHQVFYTTTANPFALSHLALPVLPTLTLGSLSLWSAVMSILLLTTSELVSPLHPRTGILINRRRLRVAGLLLAALFVAVTALIIVGPYFIVVPTR